MQRSIPVYIHLAICSNMCNIKIMSFYLISTIILAILKIKPVIATYADQPCAARAIANRSVVCICTAEYCDTVIRETPQNGAYVTYTSSEAGQRFNKTSGFLTSYEKDALYNETLELDPTIRFQNISGFGGAVTDAAGLNWKNLSDTRLMQNLIESYYGTSGIQFNMMRVPIGGTDFSTHPYAYNEQPENDTALSNFTLSYEDYEYKIPMIKACMAAADVPVYIVSSTWSPPIWMKTNNNYTGYSRLKREYLQTYADYHMKFIQKYHEENITIWGITTTNEPLDGTIDYVAINNLGWTLDYLGEWIEQNIGPTLRNSTYKDVKIITGDDQRYTISLYWNTLVLTHPGTLDYLDGVAVHFYVDKFVPASILSTAMADYPDKFVIATEASSGAQVTDTIAVDFGSWTRAVDYFIDILEDLNNNVIGWIDWNLCLNTEGGPSWTKSAIDAAIIVDAEAGEIIKQPMFYAMGHFSKFVPRGSSRIQVVGATCTTTVQNVAFLTPENTIVVVLYNDGEDVTIRIRLGDKQAVLQLEENSFTTVEFNSENSS